MNAFKQFSSRRTCQDQRGQVLPWMAFMMLLFVGIGAFVLDIGHAFYCYRELQSASDAAALAGALQLNTNNTLTTATSYSATAGSQNVYPALSINGSNSVSMVPGYPVLKCLSTIKSMGIGCTAPNYANAIQVKEQAVIPTFFARVFGMGQMTISTTSTAAISGAKSQPYNVAVIIDTTASMKTVDTNCDGGAERVICAEMGVQTLLQNLYPCSSVLGCGSITNGVSQNALDSVAIFTFPPSPMALPPMTSTAAARIRQSCPIRFLTSEPRVTARPVPTWATIKSRRLRATTNPQIHRQRWSAVPTFR